MRATACAVSLLATSVLWAADAQRTDPKAEARAILKELVEINTTDSAGDTTRAAEAMAARLLAAGFPKEDVQVLAPAPRKGNLVVRYRGTGGACRPILFLAHLDVVEARPEDWSLPPFRLTEKDGWFYGRGSEDDKAGDTALVANLARLKREGFRPARDLIVALTADEEGAGDHNGVEWLLRERRDLIDAEACVNTDAGAGLIENGKRVSIEVQSAEKTYLTVRLEATNPGGHSSLPVRENAIYEVAGALLRIQEHTFPVKLNSVTRPYFEQLAKSQTGQVADDLRGLIATPPRPEAVARLAANPYYNALMRTTCVATMLNAGHAENTLPQRAVATVNCRLVPDDSEDGVVAILRRVIADSKIAVEPVRHAQVGPVSAFAGPAAATVQQVAQGMWPGLPLAPVMETGGTDGMRLRLAGIPTWGISGMFEDPTDTRAHGRDERIHAEEFYESIEFYYRLMKAFGTGQGCPAKVDSSVR